VRHCVTAVRSGARAPLRGFAAVAGIAAMPMAAATAEIVAIRIFAPLVPKPNDKLRRR
jgi:hypothetical protein